MDCSLQTCTVFGELRRDNLIPILLGLPQQTLHEIELGAEFGHDSSSAGFRQLVPVGSISIHPTQVFAGAGVDADGRALIEVLGNLNDVAG